MLCFLETWPVVTTLQSYNDCDCKQARPWGHFEVHVYIQCSSSLDMFTCPYTSDTQLVQSIFTKQHGYRASAVFLWSCHGDCKLTCLFDNEAVFFCHFLNHPQGLLRWLKFEWARFICFSPSSACLFVLSCWKWQSLWWKHIIIRGWAVSVFTMPAPLCVFHSNCLHCQDVTKQISLERGERRCFSNMEGQWLLQAIPSIFPTFQTQRS